MAGRGGVSTVLVAVLAVALAAVVGGVGWLVVSSQPVPAARQAPQGQAVQQGQPAPAGQAPQEAPAAPQTPFASMLSAGEVRSVRLVGDSICAGFGTDGYEDPDYAGDGNVIYDDGSTRHFETSASAQSWANAFRAFAAQHGVGSFVNAGINGAFMAELAANPDAWLREGADVVVVALGTNDAGYYGPYAYREAARAALAAAAAKSRLVVALSPVADLRPAEQLVEPAAELGDVLREVCEQGGYLFVDTRQALGPDMFCDDGLHPNTAGSLAIWECLKSALGV